MAIALVLHRRRSWSGAGSPRGVVYFVGTDRAARADRHDLPRPALRAAAAAISLYERYAGSGVTLAAGPRRRAARRSPNHKLRSRDDAENLVIALETGPARAVSARNRELLALVPASLLLTAGFAAIFIQESDRALGRLADLRRGVPRPLPRRRTS